MHSSGSGARDCGGRARRAYGEDRHAVGVAAGTLFTYFANKEELGSSIRPEYAVVVAKLPSRYTPVA